MNTKNIIIIVITILLTGSAAWILTLTFLCEDDWCYIFPWQRAQAILSYEECKNSGYPTTLSYPATCRAGNKIFQEAKKQSIP